MNDDEEPDSVDLIAAAWRRERPDIDVGSIGVVTRIWRIGRHLDRHRKQRLEVLGTDRVTLDVLATLRRSGPPYQRTAGELMHSSLITSGGCPSGWTSWSGRGTSRARSTPATAAGSRCA